MKKLAIASALAAALLAVSASAATVSVSAVNDYTAGQPGFKATAEVGNFWGVTPQLSATHVNNRYNRYAVGAEYGFVSLGPVKFAATGEGAYQRTFGGLANGYGLGLGVKAETSLAKNVSLTAGYSRFFGQEVIKASNGNTLALGVKYSF